MVRLFPRQAEAFAHGDKNDLTAFFKFFPDNVVDKFLVVKSARKVCSEIIAAKVEGRTFQELLRDGNWIRPYWDIEYYADAPVEVGAARRRVINAFHKLLNVVFPFIGETFDKEKTKWSDSEVQGQFPLCIRRPRHCVRVQPGQRGPGPAARASPVWAAVD